LGIILTILRIVGISRIEDYSNFGKRLKQEAKRRNHLDVNNLVVIGDGAKWIWELANKDYPFATQIIDWFHAKEHLFNLSKLLYCEDNKKDFNIFLEKSTDLLFDGKIDELDDMAHYKIMGYYSGQKKMKLGIYNKYILC
jgi:hypothetical protein